MAQARTITLSALAALVAKECGWQWDGEYEHYYKIFKRGEGPFLGYTIDLYLASPQGMLYLVAEARRQDAIFCDISYHRGLDLECVTFHGNGEESVGTAKQLTHAFLLAFARLRGLVGEDTELE